jgi:hypothetical protein
MKRALFLLLTVVMMASATNAQVEGQATSIPTTESVEKTYDVVALEARLHEIKDMDRSNMTKEERKALREEVRSIRSDLTSSNQGVYLSFGALVIIILILILIL